MSSCGKEIQDRAKDFIKSGNKNNNMIIIMNNNLNYVFLYRLC